MKADRKVARLVVVAAWTIASVGSLAGCGGGGDDGPPPDPSGTITTSINYTTSNPGFELYYGLGDDGPYDNNGNPMPGCTTCFPYVTISLTIPSAAMNFGFHHGVSRILGTYANPYWDGLGPGGGEVADVGPVSGLADVTAVPSAGWSGTNVAVQVGHGYVARFKRSPQYVTAAVPYVYVRVYVVEYLKNVFDEIIGAKVKYQLPMPM